MDKKEKQKLAVELLTASPKTSYQIAKDTGITEATIGNYRNGKTMPQGTNVQVLLEYFGEMLKTAAPQQRPADTIEMPREVFNQISDLVATVKSQQTSIESLSRSFENLSKKGPDAEEAGHAAPRAEHG